MIQVETKLRQTVTGHPDSEIDTKVRPVINIKGLYKSFGKNTDILKGVDLTVKKGENLVVLGKSGSGKSVLIKCLVGLVTIDDGKINLMGKDISELETDELNSL